MKGGGNQMRDRAFPEGNVSLPAASLTWLCQARVFKGRWHGAIICDGILLYICTPFSCSSFQHTRMFLCKELTPFLRWIIPSTSDTSTFPVRLIKRILPQLVMNLMCCDSHKQGNKENPHMSADLSKTSISQHQEEQDVSPEVTAMISWHRNLWVQRLMCQVLLTQNSSLNSLKRVILLWSLSWIPLKRVILLWTLSCHQVWYCAFLGQRAGKNSRLSNFLSKSVFLSTGNIEWEKVASIPQVMHCKVSVHFTQLEGTLWNYRRWKLNISKCERARGILWVEKVVIQIFLLERSSAGSGRFRDVNSLHTTYI